jgi:protein ImuB
VARVVDGMTARFGCVRVPAFAAAAAERCEPALREVPLAVVTGSPPATRVLDANASAREDGVAPGMADAEAVARCPGLTRRPASDEAVASARHALLDACLSVSPRVEDTGGALAARTMGGAYDVHVDVAGLGRLVGPDDAVGRWLVQRAHAVGLVARVGIADTRAAASVAARCGPRVHVVAPRAERETLAGVSLATLELAPDLAHTLARWGVTTLGALAALPRDGLATRLGRAGLAAHDLACGRDREPFRPYAPPPFWQEAQGLEWEVDSLPALDAVLERVLARLCARLEAAHQLADALEVRLALAPGGHHVRAVPLACPMSEPRPMHALLALALAAHPPPAPVTAVAISATAVPRRAVAGGLWRPPVPAVRDLADVLARLASLVGATNIGTPVLEDCHRPDAYMLARFAPPAGNEGEAHTAVTTRPAAGGALVLRRLRPPRIVEVETDEEGRPTLVLRALSREARVVECAGPWRASGEWWDATAWARDEWDVGLADGTLCRLTHDPLNGRWYLDGVYD